MNDSQLIPVEDLTALVPDVFMAIDYTEPDEPGIPRRAVGKFVGWGPDNGWLVLEQLIDAPFPRLNILTAYITAAWFAPAGYRP